MARPRDKPLGARTINALLIGGLLGAIVTSVLAAAVGDWLRHVYLAIACLAYAAVLLVFQARTGVDTRTRVLVLLLIPALSVTPAVAPSRGTYEFYSAVAQIVPVLLLAMALEARLFRLGPIRRPVPIDTLVQAGVVSLTLLVLVFAELRSLAALASTHPRTYAAEYVYTAVAVGVLVIAFMAVFGVPPQHDGDAEAARQPLANDAREHDCEPPQIRRDRG